MSNFKTYRVRTEVGKDTHLNVKLEQNYDVIEVMSLKIDQKNAYRFHSSEYGVVAGRVLANGALGIPNAKVSVFINIDDTDIYDPVKAVLYPYNTTKSKNSDDIRYNLLSNEKVNDCHAVIGTFPEKQYMLDNDCVLEVFEKYYKFTTKTNHAGDYMIFGVPTGNQTIHVDLDLSDIGILSQKPRDMIYKGYDVNQFENSSKFRSDVNLDSLVQVISQDNVTNVIPFWGDEEEGSIGITRCDINIQYKFEPTCVFLGSLISDTSSNGISKKCIPSPNMGAMDEMVAGMGTIEMIRKTPTGGVEEFQVKGTQLINGDGVWCYQIPMNLDYMMTDEYGNMVPTNDPNKGIPIRTRVRFRVSMQDFENDNANIFRCKMLVPNNPEKYDEIDYQFGSSTKEESFRDLFWNGVYSVKSYIPRIQKGTNWKNGKFTGFKRVNYYGDKNPLPYNNIRIRIPFMFTLVCTLIKTFILVVKFVNALSKTLHDTITTKRTNATFTVLDGTLCSDDLDNVCIIPGVNIQKIVDNHDDHRITAGVLARTLELFVMQYTGKADRFIGENDGLSSIIGDDSQSIDINNNPDKINQEKNSGVSAKYGSDEKSVEIFGVRVTDSLDYIIQCIEMNLAQEYRVVQFDFYNDWINGLVYIPRWMRNITKKRTFLWGLFSTGGKIKACNSNFKSAKRNIVQQCGLDYSISNTSHNVTNNVGCDSSTMNCHKSKLVRKSIPVLQNGGIVHDVQTMKGQYVYYFKPCEGYGGKKVQLFATDIILLGTLNECDKWGIPNSLSELQSSTFQMPTNIALTDSDIDGDTYENSGATISFKYKKEQDSTKEGKQDNVKIESFELHPKALTLRDEDGNYTELSGIDWGYTGPLQVKHLTDKQKKEEKLYKPGGHFLGLSCRNSQTTIKTCVNLSRICEHGVWMSQRQQLTIPGTSEKDFIEINTIPSGFISRDEISDTNYRWQFATMNHNGLKTTINKETGYPIYDFIGVTPVNFGGELAGKINDSFFNKEVQSSVTEHYYNYNGDDEYYKRTKDSYSRTINEREIVRTGEWVDNEYWRFRLGLKGDNSNILNEKTNKYLISNNDNSPFSFPMYENSFYFYFGIKNGATALDEFKKNYYAVCESTNDLMQIDNSVSIVNLSIGYDSQCGGNTGNISFNISANEALFESDGIRVINNTLSITDNVTAATESVNYTNLATGIYSITIETNDGNRTEQEIYVGTTSINAEVKGYAFNKDVSEWSWQETFSAERTGKTASGGYIEIKGNSYEYESGLSFVNSYDAFGGDIMVIKFTKDGKEEQFTTSSYSSKIFTYKNENAPEVQLNVNTGNYMIPVPYSDTTYEVFIKNSLVPNCNEIYLGSCTVMNGEALNFMYNGVSYRNILSKIEKIGVEGKINSVNGWWENLGQLLEPEETEWKLKTGMYVDTVDEKVFSVSINPYGGTAPYTEKVCGMTESLSTTNVSRSDFESVLTPTLNYKKNGTRRYNFSYQVQDTNGQEYPKTGFVFPVIYKPFFMEMGLWYFDENQGYQLIGNVYNGKTWDWQNEGFNDCKLNGMTVSNLVELNERDEYLCNGYNYDGTDFAHNARIGKINRQVEPVTYGLYTNKPISNVQLSVGTTHSLSSGVVYKDNTNISRNNLRLYSFTLSGESKNNSYYIWMKLNNADADYETYIVYDDATTGYLYPLKNGEVDVNSLNKLQNDLINGTITASTFSNGLVEGGKINLSKASDGKVYYIAVNKNNEKENGSKSNKLSILKGISISNVINLKTMGAFYPLDVNVTGRYTKTSSGEYQIEMTVKSTGDTKSIENFKNKTYNFTFYKMESDGGQTILQTVSRSVGNGTSFIINLLPYKDILGFTDHDISLAYYFEVVDNAGIKSPARYDEGKYINFDFVDNTPKEEE